MEELKDAVGRVVDFIVGKYSYFSHFKDALYWGRPKFELGFEVHAVTNWMVILYAPPWAAIAQIVTLWLPVGNSI